MGVLLAFFAGWATCARAGTDSHDEVIRALKAVRDSEEVADLIKAMRSHAGYAFKEFGHKLLDSADGRPIGVPEIIARVRAVILPATGTSPGS